MLDRTSDFVQVLHVSAVSHDFVQVLPVSAVSQATSPGHLQSIISHKHTKIISDNFDLNLDCVEVLPVDITSHITYKHNITNNRFDRQPDYSEVLPVSAVSQVASAKTATNGSEKRWDQTGEALWLPATSVMSAATEIQAYASASLRKTSRRLLGYGAGGWRRNRRHVCRFSTLPTQPG
eukprot:g1081.t1